VALGNNLTAVSQMVGVTRQTVSDWRNHNPAFAAAVNQRREELSNQLRNRLFAMVAMALDVLEQKLKAGEFRAAVEVLKASGMYGLPQLEGLANGTPKKLTLEEIRAITDAMDEEDARRHEAETAGAKALHEG